MSDQTYVGGVRDYSKTVGRNDALEARVVSVEQRLSELVVSVEQRLSEISKLGGIPGPKGDPGVGSKAEVIDQLAREREELQKFVREELDRLKTKLRVEFFREYYLADVRAQDASK